MKNQKYDTNMNRRSLLRTAAVTGAGLVISPLVFGQQTTGSLDDINVAIIGAGIQGHNLIRICLQYIPSVRFKAVCDIWANYNLLRASRTLQAYNHNVNVYEDYLEMLENEPGLDAVIIATPDFWHSRQTIACLEAGLHVYCEKEMSNTIDGARKMVEAARRTGKLLQIGRQRRSNNKYIFCYEKYIQQAKLLDQITNTYAQWNRSVAASEFMIAPPNANIDPVTLTKYGYNSVEQFRNWRWFKGLRSGPVVDYGAHQIDIFNWFLEAKPKSVMASGGNNYWIKRQLPDNVVAVYEYDTDQGQVRALYQVITSNNSDTYYEKFMGSEGTLIISEAPGIGKVSRQEGVDDKKWQQWIDKGYINLGANEFINYHGLVPDNQPLMEYNIPANVDTNVPYHLPHLENFFNAIRGKESLNCPADVAYETTVTVLKINEAIDAEKKLLFGPGEFSV